MNKNSFTKARHVILISPEKNSNKSKGSEPNTCRFFEQFDDGGGGANKNSTPLPKLAKTAHEYFP